MYFGQIWIIVFGICENLKIYICIWIFIWTVFEVFVFGICIWIERKKYLVFVFCIWQVKYLDTSCEHQSQMVIFSPQGIHRIPRIASGEDKLFLSDIVPTKPYVHVMWLISTCIFGLPHVQIKVHMSQRVVYYITSERTKVKDSRSKCTVCIIITECLQKARWASMFSVQFVISNWMCHKRLTLHLLSFVYGLSVLYFFPSISSRKYTIIKSAYSTSTDKYP